ncbi:MAG: hypothetical protein HUN04_05255 [Desulfobacter sp.]|nr:MAG: hypothetical protein HUN04_05255 [Desulfobacter sp.]
MAGKSFHFNGVQAVLTDIGIPSGQANMIATASQAVDDFKEDKLIVFDDGRLFYPIVTAHEHLDPDNIDSRDASNIWMPFHFFPDDDGVCRPETDNVNALIKFVGRQIKAPDCSETKKNILVGILLHILVDTYTHEGFMGLYCRHNDISDLDSKNEFDLGVLANVLPAIGHGEALTYPDDMWRTWSYTDAQDKNVARNNQKVFLTAIRQIPRILGQLGIDAGQIDDEKAAKYKAILAKEKGHGDDFDAISRTANPAADLSYKHWKELTLRPVHSKENKYIKLNPGKFEQSEWYLFQESAKEVRTFFKKKIFPKLIVRTKIY